MYLYTQIQLYFEFQFVNSLISKLCYCNKWKSYNKKLRRNNFSSYSNSFFFFLIDNCKSECILSRCTLFLEPSSCGYMYILHISFSLFEYHDIKSKQTILNEW